MVTGDHSDLAAVGARAAVATRRLRLRCARTSARLTVWLTVLAFANVQLTVRAPATLAHRRPAAAGRRRSVEQPRKVRLQIGVETRQANTMRAQDALGDERAQHYRDSSAASPLPVAGGSGARRPQRNSTGTRRSVASVDGVLQQQRCGLDEA